MSKLFGAAVIVICPVCKSGVEAAVVVVIVDIVASTNELTSRAQLLSKISVGRSSWKSAEKRIKECSKRALKLRKSLKFRGLSYMLERCRSSEKRVREGHL